jgi:hypothetical protein
MRGEAPGDIDACALPVPPKARIVPRGLRRVADVPRFRFVLF